MGTKRGRPKSPAKARPEPTKRGRGRPPKDDRLSARVELKLTPEERGAFAASAASKGDEGISLNRWFRALGHAHVDGAEPDFSGSDGHR